MLDGRNAPGSKWMGNDDDVCSTKEQRERKRESSTTCKKIRSSFKSNSNIVRYLRTFSKQSKEKKKKKEHASYRTKNIKR